MEALAEVHATIESNSKLAQNESTASKSVEEESPYIYENDHMLFSALREQRLRFALVWKPWTKRCIRITYDGILSYAKPKIAAKDPLNEKCPAHKKFLLEDIEVSLMADDDIGSSDVVEYGLIVKCHTVDRMESQFRCIIEEKELSDFLTAMKRVARKHNIDRIPRQELQLKTIMQKYYIWRSKQSVMRRAVSTAMDRHDRRTKRQRILAKRGAFHFLPILMSNDLIHGSWWFVWGSVGVVITCAVVVANKYYHELNDDDSDLSDGAFVASWLLLLISGIFSTLGSLAFVRAFHENPPMAPLFTWYHVQSDELLASWLFFFACFPFVPYVLIFVTSGYNGLVYLIGLAFAIVAACGCLLFVRACYPSDKTHRDILLPLSKYFCCCSSIQFREYYFMNDWLGGSWFFCWGSIVGTFSSLVLFLVAISERDGLQIWIMGTSFLESILFLIGSAYFVAGSYPDSYLLSLRESSGAANVDEADSDKTSSFKHEETAPTPTPNPMHIQLSIRSNNYAPFSGDDDFAVV